MDFVSRDHDTAPLRHEQPQNPLFAAYAPASEVDESILRRLLRRKLLFMSAFLIVCGAVAGAYAYFPGTYKAEASITILPSDEVLASQRAASGDQMTVGDSADLESQSIVMSSPMLLREVIAKLDIQAALLSECASYAPPLWKRSLRVWLGLQPRRSCHDQVADTAGMVADLHSRIGVTTAGRSRVLSLTFVSRTPSIAQSIANEIVQAYVDLRIREKLQPRDAAIAWLRNQTTITSDRLKHNESRIESFLQANGVIRGETASIASEQLTGLAQQISIAEADQAAAAGRMQLAKQQTATTSAALQNSTTSDIKQRLAALTADIAQSSARYGSGNPALQELQQQRRELQALLVRETGVVNRSAEADYQAATSRVDTLRRQLDVLKREVRGNDDATTQVADLQRDATTDRELLLDLTRNLNQLETDRRLVTPNARVVNWAELPRDVYFPKYSVFVLGGLLLASAVATGAALLRDRADRTVRTVSLLQNDAELPVLARVPYVQGLDGRTSKLLAELGRPSPFQDAIRALYAECLLVGSGRSRTSGQEVHALRSFLVTSSDRAEGKSVTTIALARIAASAGQRVLILECDLRRPDIGRSLSLGAKPGVSDVLRRLVLPSEAVRQSEIPRLDVILAGKTVTDSAELLGSSAMTELLAWAATSYDLVLLDTPPSRVLPDARILSSSVDCVLYCARWGHSIRGSVTQGVHEIQAAGGHVLGLVLGSVQRAQFRQYNLDDLRTRTYPALEHE